MGRNRHAVQRREGVNGVTWRAVVDLGPDPATGKRRQTRVSAPTRKALDDAIADVVTRARSGGARVDRTTRVDAFMREWLEVVRHEVKPATYRTYRQRMDTWIIPRLGRKKLVTLTAADIQQLNAGIMASGRSSSTASAVYTVLRAALGDAVKWGVLPVNPCAAVSPPRSAAPEMRTWSLDEVGRVLAAADDDPLGMLWRLAITTGMRRGELIGLRWQDVDLERNAISIRHTLVRGEGGHWESSTPKTAKGRRVVAISEADARALRAHRSRQAAAQLQAEQWADHGYVFTGANGGPVHQTALQRAFADLIKRAGVPAIRFHDLRHTAATLMLANGEHPKIVSERLGHANISMTLDRYSHVTKSMQDDAAERLSTLIDGTRKQVS